MVKSAFSQESPGVGVAFLRNRLTSILPETPWTVVLLSWRPVWVRGISFLDRIVYILCEFIELAVERSDELAIQEL